MKCAARNVENKATHDKIVERLLILIHFNDQIKYVSRWIMTPYYTVETIARQFCVCRSQSVAEGVLTMS
jgi:hypothetical protein